MEGTIGEIRGFGGNFAPRNWAFCNGQLLSIGQNQALFSILGTTYGGDGRTTFGLPEMRGRVVMHAGTGPGLSTRRIGQRFGTEYNNLSSNQLPAHTHYVTSGALPIVGTANASATMKVNNDDSDAEEPNGLYIGKSDGATSYANAPGTSQFLANDAIDVSLDTSGMGVNSSAITLSMAGSSTAVNNIQPVMVVNMIICLFGVFPSRS